MKDYTIIVLLVGLLAAQSHTSALEAEKARIEHGKQLLQRAQRAMGGAVKLAAVKDLTHKMEITLTPWFN
jgi:Skp family chaperone for outer membrane proteins